MEDKQIIKLYFERDENAVAQTDLSFGKYARFIATNNLPTREDCEEVVNDAYAALWNSIPPKNSESLKAYLARVVKNIALDRLRAQNAEKRANGQAHAALDELAELLPSNETPESILDKKLLIDALERFANGLDRKSRIIFIRRYWYLSPICDIARNLRQSTGSVKTALYRLRQRLREQLEREGLL